MNYREAVQTYYKQRRAEGHHAVQALRMAIHDARYDSQTKYGRKHSIMPSRYEAYEGEEITDLPNGWKIKVTFKHDGDSGPPWKECDGIGVVTDWIRRVDNEDLHGYWELCSDRHFARYYDWKATLPEAIKDGWSTEPYHFRSKYEQAMAAMRSTYKYLRRWCQDEWWYVGMIVTLLDENDEELGEDSCWGFESMSIDYLTSEARSWAAHLIRKERRERREAARKEKINNRFREAMELGV